MNILACDVSKFFLTPYDGKLLVDTPNSAAGVRALLLAHAGYTVVCEPTSNYHVVLLDLALELGHEVFLVNPKEAKSYKDSLSFRAKNDPLDARYLYEYVLRNRDLLRAHAPINPALKELRRLIGERSSAVASRTSLSMCFGKGCSKEHEQVLLALTNLIASLEVQMHAIAKTFESYALMRAIPGVGPISACALVYILGSKQFESADQLVAFLGLDVRVRQSGRYKGLGKITKRGDSTLRYLLCAAGRGLLMSNFGANKRLELIQKKRHFAERIVIAARKVLRTAYSLNATHQAFNPSRWTWT